jgi:hypothetical protein
MEMPKLSDAHRKLDKIVGTWLGEEKIYPSPFDPQGGMAVARVCNKSALDGFAVVQDYEQVRGATVNFRGHCVFRYDGFQNCYFMHWFDSMGMPPSDFKGSFDNDVLIATAQNPQGYMRATFDFREPGRYTFRMDVSPDGNQWFPFMEGKYAKQK